MEKYDVMVIEEYEIRSRESMGWDRKVTFANGEVVYLNVDCNEKCVIEEVGVDKNG